VIEARDLLSRKHQAVKLATSMKHVPKQLDAVYWYILEGCRDSVVQSSPDGAVTWCDMQALAAVMFRADAAQALGVVQAIHYLQLVEESERRNDTDEQREERERSEAQNQLVEIVKEKQREEAETKTWSETRWRQLSQTAEQRKENVHAMRDASNADEMACLASGARRRSSTDTTSTVLPPVSATQKERQEAEYKTWSVARWHRLYAVAKALHKDTFTINQTKSAQLSSSMTIPIAMPSAIATPLVASSSRVSDNAVT
jgi:hypothetical protein